MNTFLRGGLDRLPRSGTAAQTILRMGRDYAKGRYADVVEALPKRRDLAPLHLHMRLLALRAWQLLGQSECAEAECARLLSLREAHPSLDVWWHFELVLAEHAIHFGRFVPARQKGEAARSAEHRMGLFERLRLAIVLGHVAQAQGRAALAASALAQQKRLIDALEFTEFLTGWQRRRIIFFLDTEDYPRAERALRKVLAEASLPHRMRLLLLKERLRLELRRGPSPMLDDTLQAIEATVSADPALRSVAVFHEESCELALQRANTSLSESREAIEKQMAAAQRRGDVASQCLTRFLHGRLLAGEGALEDALHSLDTAETLARQEEYGRVLVRILLFRVGLLLRLRRQSQAALVLAEAEDRARSAHLPVQLACCRMLRHHSQGNHPPVKEMADVFNRLRSLHEFVSYMNFYGLNDKWMVSIRAALGSRRAESLPLLLSFEKIFAVRGWYVFEKPQLVLHSSGRSLRLFQAGEGILVERAIAHLFLSYGDEIPFSELHAIALPHVPYRSSRHSAKIRTLLRRVRLLLDGLDVALAPGHEPESIRVESREACFRLSIEENHVTRDNTSELANRLLARIAAAPNSTLDTHALCREFQLSRQRLSYTLKPLRASGKVKLVNRGRTSRWMARS